MKYLKYPDEETVNAYIAQKEPLLAAIAFDGEKAFLSHIDDSVEHHILIAHFDLHEKTDNYFRVTIDSESADWTFVCPRDYKNIQDRQRRITAFYNDGIALISRLLSDIGYFSDIRIPKRYRRHFDAMGDDTTFLPY